LKIREKIKMNSTAEDLVIVYLEADYPQCTVRAQSSDPPPRKEPGAQVSGLKGGVGRGVERAMSAT
jgi:hypothetical protein